MSLPLHINHYFNHKIIVLILSICTSLIVTHLSIGNVIAAEDGAKVIVFAAASLTDVITEIAAQYEKDTLVPIQTAFASSSTLAKQIENGAPADIFISADKKWMDYLKHKNALNDQSIINLLGNYLVLITPKGKGFKVETQQGFAFSNAFSGKLCTGETESVPAGIYAKQALKSMSWWQSIKARVVGTQDVRAALVLVERGECDVGIVYATDAKVSQKVGIISKFPESSHEPIVYPLSLTKHQNSAALGFYNYLKSKQANLIFTKYGFNVIKQ